jgi:hypothetical protein
MEGYGGASESKSKCKAGPDNQFVVSTSRSTTELPYDLSGAVIIRVRNDEPHLTAPERLVVVDVRAGQLADNGPTYLANCVRRLDDEADIALKELYCGFLDDFVIWRRYPNLPGGQKQYLGVRVGDLVLKSDY